MADFPQLTEEDYNQFNSFLGDMLAKSEASLALIVEKAGHLIHECGPSGQFETTFLSTLASNAFNATAFMANLMGESKFGEMYQQGENFSTLIFNVDEHCVLIVIFKAGLSVGAVKYYASLAIPQVASQIQTAKQRAPGVGFDLTDLDVTDAAALFRRQEPVTADAEAAPTAAPVSQALPAAPPAAPPEPAAVPALALAPEPEPTPAAVPVPASPPAAPPAPPAPSPPIVPGKPIVPKRGPYVVAVGQGLYYWCACGRSQSQPYCDGSHNGTGLEPMQVEITQDQKRAFCGCKHTKHAPFCDGSHARVKL